MNTNGCHIEQSKYNPGEARPKINTTPAKPDMVPTRKTYFGKGEAARQGRSGTLGRRPNSGTNLTQLPTEGKESFGRCNRSAHYWGKIQTQKGKEKNFGGKKNGNGPTKKRLSYKKKGGVLCPSPLQIVCKLRLILKSMLNFKIHRGSEVGGTTARILTVPSRFSVNKQCFRVRRQRVISFG